MFAKKKSKPKLPKRKTFTSTVAATTIKHDGMKLPPKRFKGSTRRGSVKDPRKVIIDSQLPKQITVSIKLTVPLETVVKSTYQFNLILKGDHRIITPQISKVLVDDTLLIKEKGKKVKEAGTIYRLSIHRALLQHIDLVKEGTTTNTKYSKLLAKIKKAEIPKIDGDVVTFLKNLGVDVTAEVTKINFQGKKRSFKVKDKMITLIPKEKMNGKRRLQDDMSAEEYLGETLFLGLKF